MSWFLKSGKFQWWCWYVFIFTGTRALIVYRQSSVALVIDRKKLRGGSTASPSWYGSKLAGLLLTRYLPIHRKETALCCQLFNPLLDDQAYCTSRSPFRCTDSLYPYTPNAWFYLFVGCSRWLSSCACHVVSVHTKTERRDIKRWRRWPSVDPQKAKEQFVRKYWLCHDTGRSKVSADHEKRCLEKGWSLGVLCLCYQKNWRLFCWGLNY